MAEVEAIAAFVRDCEQHDIGEPLLEVEDVIATWQRPSFRLEQQTVVVRDGENIAAFGEVNNSRAEVYVHPGVRGRGLGAALLGWTWDVARAAGADRVGQTVPQGLTDAIDLFRRHGYEQLWTSWILELPEQTKIASPALPDEVVIRAAASAADERSAYQVIEDAFNEWPNRSPTAYADWASVTLGRPGFEPWQLLVAEDCGDVVGACYVSIGEGTGFVHQIAVRQDHRGRGIARALLVQAFRETRSRGAHRAELSTDSRTGALSLYEHVGMHVRYAFSHWERSLDAALV